MGSASPCTCNTRICNYHKEDGYGFKNDDPVISETTQLTALSKTLSAFMSPSKSPVAYLNTDGTNPSQKAINALRNSIASVSPIEGLSLQPFCINLTDSYEKKASDPTTPPATKEGYTSIKPASHTCSVIICIIIGIILFGFACYIVYSYVSCPCRKKHENDLREAQAIKDELSE